MNYAFDDNRLVYKETGSAYLKFHFPLCLCSLFCNASLFGIHTLKPIRYIPQYSHAFRMPFRLSFWYRSHLNGLAFGFVSLFRYLSGECVCVFVTQTMATLMTIWPLHTLTLIQTQADITIKLTTKSIAQRNK